MSNVMNDKELLLLAAKSIGINRRFYELAEEFGLIDNDNPNKTIWNPLLDDGDALRLATKLGISLTPYPFHEEITIAVVAKQRRKTDLMGEKNPTESIERYDDDADAATRRAIVRCAAKIGEELN